MADVSLETSAVADPSVALDAMMSPLLTPSRQPPLSLSMHDSLSNSLMHNAEDTEELRAECRSLRSKLKAQNRELEADRGWMLIKHAIINDKFLEKVILRRNLLCCCC
jgi:hypothetical protein